MCCFFFFFNDPATPEIYPLPLHDPLPISIAGTRERPTTTTSSAHGSRFTIGSADGSRTSASARSCSSRSSRDRKSTRLNSSHSQISYAVFCLKKKKQEHCMMRCNQILSAL